MGEPVFFWSGPFSQWYRSPFEINGSTYRTAEHWMMASKAALFQDTAVMAEIMKAKDPSDVKALGRQIAGYDDETWRKVRFQIVCRGSYEKFRQSPELLAYLLDTGDREIVEASPYDKIWGVGMGAAAAATFYREQMLAYDWCEWPGLNLLGEALMAARTMLQPR